MIGQYIPVLGYTVDLAATEGDAYRVTYTPEARSRERGGIGRPKRLSEHSATLHARRDAPVTWDRPPADGRGGQAALDEDAHRRVLALHEWLNRLVALVGSVRGWAEEIGWSTKVIAKPMEDSTIGNYKAPALLLQEQATRLLLEPVARITPGSEGSVDLYSMPAYDDVANVYYYANRWNIHYPAEVVSDVVGGRGGEAKALTAESLRIVIDGLKGHAG